MPALIAEGDPWDTDQLFRAFFENAPIGALIMAPDATLLRVNRAFPAMLGYSPGALHGTSLLAITHPDDVVRGREALRAMLAGERESLAFEKRLRAIDGRDVWVHITTRIQTDTSGGSPLFLAHVLDVTARRTADTRLRASEIRYRRLFESAKDGILILDAETGCVVEVNPFMTELTGFARKSFLGKHLWEIGPFADIAASKASFAELQQKDYVRYEHLPLKTPDGREVAVEFVSNVYLVDDKKVIQCNIRDETARRHLEAQLLQAQKMEAVGRLAGGVAHDFNNFLSVILSYAELIDADLKPGEPLHDDVEEIKRAALRAAGVAKQLLAFSRQQIMEPRVINLNDLLAGLEKMLGRLLGADIELTMLTTRSVGNIKADPGQIEQIVMNLAVNARDAMPVGGHLTLATANVELDDDYARMHADVRAGAYVQLAVTDDGVGMPRETLQRVFEPFFTTKEQGKGTGLGLATVFGIVKQSGGHISVYSEPGKGTTFRAYFPEVGGNAAAHPLAAIAPEPERSTGTILLVEDEEQVRVLARTILRRQGYVVLDAPNGGEALLICEQHGANIDLLLTDVVLPRMSGRQLAERLAPARPTMKVLYMSGYTDDAILQHGILDSGVAFLQKPFTPATLTRRVREVLIGTRLPPRGLAS